MKILLITGLSGTGKSTIVEKLLQYDGYHNIKSFTDRPQRKEEKDVFSNHIFVSSDRMESLLKVNSDIVAQTQIERYSYCTFFSQFDENMVNVYIVDLKGMNDVIESFPYADIMTVLIRRNNCDVDSCRKCRNLAVPARDDVDFCLDNNGPIENIKSIAGTLNVLVKNDFFKKPSHKAHTIEDLLECCDKKEEYLSNIRMSLEKQKWYRDKPIYDDFCKFLQKDIDEFDVCIKQENEPFFDDGCCKFDVQIIPEEELSWPEECRLSELATKSLWKFKKAFNIDSSIILNFSISIINKVDVI